MNLGQCNALWGRRCMTVFFESAKWHFFSFWREVRIKESHFENESPRMRGPWLAECVIPVCSSFLSWWMVRSCEPMGEQRWGCNCDPGKNSPLFLGRQRSVTCFWTVSPTAHWQVRLSRDTAEPWNWIICSFWAKNIATFILWWLSFKKTAFPGICCTTGCH